MINPFQVVYELIPSFVETWSTFFGYFTTPLDDLPGIAGLIGTPINALLSLVGIENFAFVDMIISPLALTALVILGFYNKVKV